MKNLIVQELSKNINSKLTKELLKEYEDVSRDYFLGDSVKLLLSSGRFVDVALACIQYWYEKKVPNLNLVSFDTLFKKITNFPRIKKDGMEDLLLLQIPHVAKAVYTIRNKKRGAHRKDFDPITQDIIFIKHSVDWILSSLLFAFHTKTDIEIQGIIGSLVEKSVPFIEEFEDGGIQILKKTSFAEKILLVLYKQSKMITIEELKKLTKPKYASEFNTNLNNLKKRLLIYKNGNDVKLNKNGIREVEDIVLQK